MRWWRKLGPGLITGASDDDPSGIATYSIAGASLGYGLLWVALITTPMMIVVQEMCARIGRVSGRGLTDAMRHVLPSWLVLAMVVSVVIANTLNIAADIAGMSSAAELVTHLPAVIWAVAFGILLIVVEVYLSYPTFANIAKWLCLTLFAYIATAFVVRVDWVAALHHSFVPEIRFERTWLATLVGFLGTTITPYLFIWQAAEEIEEERKIGLRTLRSRRGATPEEIADERADVTIGMLYSNVVTWFIVVATAATLHAHHVSIVTVRDAAEALRPLAGNFAYLLFTLGVVGAGLLAVPVMAGSSAYALCDCFGWRGTLSAKPRAAPYFYSVIAIGIGLGVVADLAHLDAVWALFWAAVVNGFVAVPMLIGIVLTGNRRAVMGHWINSLGSRIWMWITIALMSAAAIGLVLTSGAR